MYPKKFPESNVIFAEDQPEYRSMPAYKSDAPQGDVVTCWKLSLKERILALIKGEIWVHTMNFDKPVSPIFISVEKKDIFKEDKQQRKL